MKAVNNYIELKKLDSHSKGVMLAVEKAASYTVVDKGVVDDILNESVVYCSPKAIIEHNGRLFAHSNAILYVK